MSKPDQLGHLLNGHITFFLNNFNILGSRNITKICSKIIPYELS